MDPPFEVCAMQKSTIKYTPLGPVTEKTVKLFPHTRNMFAEVCSSRSLIWRLFLRDFSARYRQSVLGAMWAILMPLITVAVFVAMNVSGILKVEGLHVPYALYAIIGLSVWNLFTVGVINAAGSIVNAGSMIGKVNFPRSSLVIAAVGQGLVELLVRIILIAVLFAFFETSPSIIGSIRGLISILPLCLLMIGCGFIFALLSAVFRDVIHVLHIALTGFMLVSPILYPMPPDSFLGEVNVINPINYLVNVPRDLVLTGYSDLLPGFWWSSIFSVCVFIVGWRFFFLAQPKIVERL